MWDGGAAAPIAARRTISGDTAFMSEVVIPAGQVKSLTAGWPNGNITAIYITVEDNDDGTVVIDYNANPSHRLTFPTGGGEVIWTNRFVQSRPVSAESGQILHLKITNNATTDATVKIRVLSNALFNWIP
jgi:hypothetical protein